MDTGRGLRKPRKWIENKVIGQKKIPGIWRRRKRGRRQGARDRKRRTMIKEEGKKTVDKEIIRTMRIIT